MDKFEYRIAGSDWFEVDMPEDNPVCFMMDTYETDFVTFDTFDGKNEYRRVRE